MRSVNEYLNELYNALNIYNSNNNGYGDFERKEGAIKLAKDIGYCFYDFPIEEINNVIGSTYSTICVRYYNLKPPISAKEWVKHIWLGYEYMKNRSKREVV